MKALECFLDCQRVKWSTDNQNVRKIIKKGSVKPELQCMALEIFMISVWLFTGRFSLVYVEVKVFLGD